ncbi:septin 7 [Nematocida homosporus]|uniref:septin 7 n=1 Tax=Nematocida homosporus TaxID=1912981 RepID=UPI00221ECACD|nr:septin 7 [Nematocida homosporus]KAI5184976.1 septin 7 [Nematocida homosporus]
MEQTSSLVNTLPNQIIKGIEDTGINYNIIVAGEGYSGKTSLIQSLFGIDMQTATRDNDLFHEVCDMVCTNNPLADLLEAAPAVKLDSLGISVSATRVTLQEESIHLNLTIYEISHIGDSLKNQLDWTPIRNLIFNRYEEYHMEEDLGTNIQDKRIHCCLYLTNPRIIPRQVDINVMKEIGQITNLIPVISKADTLTSEEYKQMKETLFSTLVAHKVQLFDSILIDECKKVVELNFVPLRFSTLNRIYPYHAHQSQHTQESDLVTLRDLLIKSHAIDLVEVTEKYYEHYRRNKMIVDVLTATDSGLDENFKRKIGLEETKLKTLTKRLAEKKKNYLLLISQHKHLISEDLI